MISSRGAPTDTDQFGVFDYVVWVKGKRAKDAKLVSGDIASFVFAIGGAGPFTAADFTSELSLIDAGESAAYAAALFGVDNNSPIGAIHAPEPTTGLLVGMGICLLTANQIRRRLRPSS